MIGTYGSFNNDRVAGANQRCRTAYALDLQRLASGDNFEIDAHRADIGQPCRIAIELGKVLADGERRSKRRGKLISGGEQRIDVDRRVSIDIDGTGHSITGFLGVVVVGQERLIDRYHQRDRSDLRVVDHFKVQLSNSGLVFV